MIEFLRDVFSSGKGVWRIAAQRFFAMPQSTEPTASVDFRGAAFVAAGGTGVADQVKICLKDGSDAYAWQTWVVPGGVYTDEQARDAIGTALVAGNNIDITVNDGLNTITVAVETLTAADISDVTSSAAELNVLDGIPGTLTATELGYVDGVTSAIQTQLDAKQPLDSDLTTIAGLADPNADRILFWDDSAGAYAYLAASTGLTITTTNMTVRTASATQTGIVELATDAETTTGTDTARAITPANLTSQIGTRIPALAHNHAASDITSGTMATARLGSGTANSSSYLRGDQTWDTIGIDELNDVSIAAPAQGQLLTYDTGVWVNADPQQGIMTLDDRTHAYVSQFGTTGTGNTNFDTPGQVAIDSSGNIFIADTANNRLKKHDSSGTYVTSITSLTGIVGVCVDSSDNVYIQTTSRMRKYNSSLVQQWEVLGFSGSERHITTDGTHVWGTIGDTVRKALCSTGAFVSVFGVSGSGDGQFSTAVGITNDGTYLYVVDQGNDRIQKFTMAGAYISQWGRAGSDPSEFQTAVGIHYNSVTGFLYVTDSGRDDVQEFTTTGGFVGSFGSAGSGNGELQDASGVANDVAGDSVWVADATQDRLQKFTRSVTSEEATRVSFNTNDFIVASTDGGETGFISMARPALVHSHTEPSEGGVLGPAAMGVIGIYQDSDYTGSNVNTAQKIFNESTNGAATVADSTTYLVDASFHIHSTGTSAAILSTLFGGTATYTSVGLFMDWAFATTETFGTIVGQWNSAATAFAIGGSVSTARHYSIHMKGVIRINAGGTLIPQYIFSAAPGVAPVTLTGSYFQLTPLGSSSTVTIGAWS